jgi:hypothetical protein
VDPLLALAVDQELRRAVKDQRVNNRNGYPPVRNEWRDDDDPNEID